MINKSFLIIMQEKHIKLINKTAFKMLDSKNLIKNIELLAIVKPFLFYFIYKCFYYKLMDYSCLIKVVLFLAYFLPDVFELFLYQILISFKESYKNRNLKSCLKLINVLLMINKVLGILSIYIFEIVFILSIQKSYFSIFLLAYFLKTFSIWFHKPLESEIKLINLLFIIKSFNMNYFFNNIQRFFISLLLEKEMINSKVLNGYDWVYEIKLHISDLNLIIFNHFSCKWNNLTSKMINDYQIYIKISKELKLRQECYQLKRQNLKIGTRIELTKKSIKKDIYLVIMSSLSPFEAMHKISCLQIPISLNFLICVVILECCLHETSFSNYYSDLANLTCLDSSGIKLFFEQSFLEVFIGLHKLSVLKIKIIASFFANLFYLNTISWSLLLKIKFNMETSNSSNRIFLKVFLLELLNKMGEFLLINILKIILLKSKLPFLFGCKSDKDINYINSFMLVIGFKKFKLISDSQVTPKVFIS